MISHQINSLLAKLDFYDVCMFVELSVVLKSSGSGLVTGEPILLGQGCASSLLKAAEEVGGVLLSVFAESQLGTSHLPLTSILLGPRCLFF